MTYRGRSKWALLIEKVILFDFCQLLTAIIDMANSFSKALDRRDNRAIEMHLTFCDLLNIRTVF